ncbi:MAG: hypothetical protein JRJ84_23955 [Deltaproteobacteria bacterium]|nr:hypothetical protein [Deltaproteobacteria bacterium]
MARVMITLNSVRCVDQQESGEDEVYVRWRFRLDGSHRPFYQRPPRGAWTLTTGGEQSIQDAVVNQTIHVNRLYWLDLELWEEDFGRGSLPRRIANGGRWALGKLGNWVWLPGAGIAAVLVGAIAGISDPDDLLGKQSNPVIVAANFVDGIWIPFGGLGSQVHVLNARLRRNARYEVRYTIDVTT